MPNWPVSQKAANEKVPDWYKDCFRAALLRMAVMVNVTRTKNEKDYPLSLGLLKLQDAELFKKLDKSDMAPALISLNPIKSDHKLSDDNEYRAENFFYARINFSEHDRAIGKTKRIFNRTHVTYQVPDTFIKWSYLRLQPPPGSDQELDRDKFKDNDDFIFECATNYLLKNFWHNFVHHQVQGINEGNYRDFGGAARFDSDFEADNLATIFLIRSYGLEIRAKGSCNNETAIRAIWERNRCNLVFQERAKHRHQDTERMSELERFQEAEWRFYRAICNRLSIELIARGLTVRSLRVFANGQVKKAKIGYFRGGPGKVIIELNSRRYYTKCPVYVPPEYYGAKRGTDERMRDIRSFQNRRVKDIVTSAATQYEHDLREDANLRFDAEETLKALFKRLSLPY